MELKEFISNSLCAIIDGVRDAQEQVGADKIAVVHKKAQQTIEVLKDDGSKIVVKSEMVKFDIAVTVATNTETQGKMKAGISVIGADMMGKTDKINSSVSRIQFGVNVAFHPS